ncbi:hypothetical protein [Hydrogenophaga sp. 2FB]|uniref:hypothetical protein n=1 Tax=Hydrogenophaga sp. 2FB TaxID=2502187 RepID=UPI0010F7B5F6|nr:hypothetical protein [Hydrogenophaga sp. 2FB]
MNLYEVVRWGNDTTDPFTGGPNGPDTCFLVRATSVAEAGALADIELARRTSPSVDHWAGAVHLLGADASQDSAPRILRGPYVQHAYCHGWQAWHRNGPEEAWALLERGPGAAG